MQRIILAIILGVNMGLAATQPKIAFLVQLGVIVLLLIGGFGRWCFLLEILKQLLPSCEKIEKEKK